MLQAYPPRAQAAPPAHLPRPLMSCAAFFERDAREIFKSSISARLARTVTSSLGLFDETYDPRPLEKLLKERFGWTSMASGLTHLVLTAYDLEQRKPVFLTNGLEASSGRPDDYYFWQAVRATTATPRISNRHALKISAAGARKP